MQNTNANVKIIIIIMQVRRGNMGCQGRSLTRAPGVKGPRGAPKKEPKKILDFFSCFKYDK